MDFINQEEATKRCEELRLKNISVRFFIYTINFEGDVEVTECAENVFVRGEGYIEYERHTMNLNGVNQICLTKNNLGM